MIDHKKNYQDLYPKLATWGYLSDSFKSDQSKLQETWLNLPDPEIEEYKFDIEVFKNSNLLDPNSLDDPLLVNSSEKNWHESNSSGRIFYTGHRFDSVDLSEEASSQGVIACDLFEAMKNYPDLIQKNLYSAINPDQDKLAAFQAGFLSGGVFVFLPSGVQLSKPVELIITHDSRYQEISNKHLLIVAEDNVHFSFYTRLNSYGKESSHLNFSTEIIAGDGSNINYIQINKLQKSTNAIYRNYGKVARDSHIHWSIASMDDGDSLMDVVTVLEERGATTESANISITTKDQSQYINTHAINIGNETDTQILQHGVAMDESHLVFNAVGDIRKYAKNANSEQSSRVLMMSPDSKANANPLLLVDEFEVTAGHAVTVGRVDEDQLWYLMSRGIDEKTAEFLVIRGFLSSVISNMPSEQIQEDMLEVIEYKLRNFIND